jgi:hypothetical protein
MFKAASFKPASFKFTAFKMDGAGGSVAFYPFPWRRRRR